MGVRSWMCEAKARGIYAASVCEVRGWLEKVDAVGWRTVKRRERRGPGVGPWALGVEGAPRERCWFVGSGGGRPTG